MKALKTAVKTAKQNLENGDPVEAVSTLELALYLPMSHDDRSIINKAKDEAQMGSPQAAETMLELVAFKRPTNADIERTPPRPKPFRFKPNKRSITDGAPRQISNGENAMLGDVMLDLVHDRKHLDDDSALQDGLTNLLHWCDREKVDFDEALRMARMHHESER